MIVAAGAAQRHSQERLADRVDLLIDHVRPELERIYRKSPDAEVKKRIRKVYDVWKQVGKVSPATVQERVNFLAE